MSYRNHPSEIYSPKRGVDENSDGDQHNPTIKGDKMIDTHSDEKRWRVEASYKTQDGRRIEQHFF